MANKLKRHRIYYPAFDWKWKLILIDLHMCQAFYENDRKFFGCQS